MSLVNEKGQAMVEFALSALVLFMLLFAIIDLGMMFYVNLTLQHAVRVGTRNAIIGQSAKNGKTLREALRDDIVDASNGLCIASNIVSGPTVSILTPSATAFSNYTGSPVNDTGAPDQIIIVRMKYAWPLLTPVLVPFFPPGGKYTFTASATMKNEPGGLK
jgi:Flp pilus assembly protein TadG